MMKVLMYLFLSWRHQLSSNRFQTGIDLIVFMRYDFFIFNSFSKLSRKPLKLIFFNLPILKWVQSEHSRWYRQLYPTWIAWKTCLDICGEMGFIITNQMVANAGKLLSCLTMVNWDALPWHVKMAIRINISGIRYENFLIFFKDFASKNFNRLIWSLGASSELRYRAQRFFKRF